MAKVLVTGGAGFIGSHIVDRVLADGHTVEVIDDLSSGSRDNLPTHVQLHVVDITTPQARDIVRTFKPDVMVHAAAQISVRVSMDHPEKDALVNVTGFVSLLTELRDIPGAKCIFLSTGGAIYGEQSQFPASEDHPVKPESIYGLSKWVGEHYLGFWERVWGIKCSILRLANVYGPRQNPHGEAGVVAIFCRGLLSGQSLTINGDGAQTRDFIFVGDVARAVSECVNRDLPGVFNIGTGVETSVNDLVSALTVASGMPGAIGYGPAKGGEQQRSCIDPSKAAKVFGWKAEIDLTTGVEKTMRWFKDHLVKGQ